MCIVTDKPDLLFLMHDLARQLRVDADRRASANGMTRAQWIILLQLERQPGLSQKELAELLEVEPITVARLIDRLEERGMVERRDDPHDRRIWRLHLCSPAEPVLVDLRRERADMMRMATQGLDPALVEALHTGLQRIKANVIAGTRARVAPERTIDPIPARSAEAVPARSAESVPARSAESIPARSAESVPARSAQSIIERKIA
jgi:DNA-binding MarR family transcriptional regulator